MIMAHEHSADAHNAVDADHTDDAMNDADNGIGDINDWIKAGKIAAQALEYGRTLIKPGARILDVCDAVDKKIVELGGVPAFPAQISCDNIAAHYCAPENDPTVLDKQVASLDVGVSVNGAIGDTALTVDLSGKNEALVKATREAVDNACAAIRIGITLGEIGKIIQDTIKKHGFSPVRNLSGHGLARYDIHTYPSIPNVDTGDDTVLEDGMVIAIEPFASTGSGTVRDSGDAGVYSLSDIRPVRSNYAREVLAFIVEEYGSLPFASRWLSAKFGAGKTRLAIRELMNAEILHGYPPLVDSGNGITSQAEHSVLVAEKLIILTKL
jgi:methionyl aminopeptidase